MAKKKRKSGYVPAPEIPEDLRERYAVILEVLTGVTTVTEAAQRLGLSRNRFQALMHRAQAGLLEELSPKPGGRPKERTEQEAALSQKVEQLEKENARLTDRVEMIDRLLGVAGDVLKGQARSRSKKSRSSSSTSSTTDDDDDPRRVLVEQIRILKARGLTSFLAAAVAGVAESTAARWATRMAKGECLVKKRGPMPKGPLTAEVTRKLADHVRQLKGLVGAESLRQTFGVSRRQAASIKKVTITKMERERKEEAGRVRVTQAGVLRGFDAMHVETLAERNYLLAAADGAIPFRTSVVAVPAYTGLAVAQALDDDFSNNGAPLVARLDRASVHKTDEVDEVLDHHGVLRLHGPAYYAPYYGQLERQNREHRAWLRSETLRNLDDLRAICAPMRHAFNALWRRGTLDFRTAEEMWKQRPIIEEDRTELREEVRDREARLRIRGVNDDLAARLAIEQALAQRGYLRIENARRC